MNRNYCKGKIRNRKSWRKNEASFKNLILKISMMFKKMRVMMNIKRRSKVIHKGKFLILQSKGLLKISDMKMKIARNRLKIILAKHKLNRFQLAKTWIAAGKRDKDTLKKIIVLMIEI